jgi:hypothetical protein
MNRLTALFVKNAEEYNEDVKGFNKLIAEAGGGVVGGLGGTLLNRFAVNLKGVDDKAEYDYDRSNGTRGVGASEERIKEYGDAFKFMEKDIGLKDQIISKATAREYIIPHYDPQTKVITQVGYDPATLAHEMGHAKSFSSAKNKFNKQMIQGISRITSSGLSPLISPLLPFTGEYSYPIAGVLTAASLPMIAEEIKASALGGKSLYNFYRSLGKGRISSAKGALGAFAGVPSYLSLPTIPWLSAYLGKYFGQKVEDRFNNMDLKSEIEDI